MKKAIIKAVFFACIFMALGSVAIGQEVSDEMPALRDQILLNGVWNFTPAQGKKANIPVPEFWGAKPGFNCDEAVYERQVEVPMSWKNKIVKIEFSAVQFIADVYVEGHYVGNHIGGWIPFGFDVTNYVTPGEMFTLKVVVKGGNHEPIVDKTSAAAGLSHPLWPVGWYGNAVKDPYESREQARWGIIFDVWLRAYGKCYINDAFIQTSFRHKEIQVDYELCNSDSKPHTISTSANIVNTKSNLVEKQLTGPSVTLEPGETKRIVLKTSWENPALWTPDEPNLYRCVSKLNEDGSIIDPETRRFGFREIWVSGNQLMLNGVRLNLYGENINRHIQYHADERYLYLTPEKWSSTIDRLKSINIRYARFHMAPPDPRLVDIADEKGFMILGESPIYARDYVRGGDKELYLKNCKTWITSWIRTYRNHPSIVLWSAENENGIFGLMTASEIRSLGDAVRESDPTRPVTYDGDWFAGDQLVNYHYPEGYENTVNGSIYSWAGKLKDKPTGIGEFLTEYGSNGMTNRWWMGTWIRGLRYLGFTDVRPYTLQWAWDPNQNPEMIENIKTSFAPVALFDKDYDDLGIAPIRDKVYPKLKPGQFVKRTLILYNDEFRGMTVDVEVQLKSGDTVYAKGTRSVTCKLGEHIEIPISFQVPYTKGSPVDLVLITRKDGVVKFKEAKRFNVGKAANGVSSDEVKFEK